MANLIIVCGPQAVGKMMVAESLRDKLKYNMMMNHDSIEISDKIFGFATPAQNVRRHIVGGTYRTLISVQNPLRLCRTGICRSLSAG